MEKNTNKTTSQKITNVICWAIFIAGFAFMWWWNIKDNASEKVKQTEFDQMYEIISKPKDYPQTELDIWRIYDKEADVVCWSFDRGISCLPKSETNLP